ncbi:hypothetical protein HYPSUDRAFT_67712 [Hypholoma sublateritium FD-334 SS-4]|uniref:Uncharacterized protein n=1 Tax=Hypholoma sublateritium (strain FD-334 SS-4) TaxID=945553 RepID=A0A0D2MDJ4_HYPSF|nr:hypothetical protein HYPSUDRAFT_67712 [Hypholoma sublateritium FD-334 SS-4]
MSKVALITGAARGIGKAIALRLAHDGYQIALNDISEMKKELEDVQREIIGTGQQTLICLGDVSVEDDVIKMVGLTAQILGSLDVMIANAGVCLVKSLIETTGEDFHRLLSINVDGVFFCYKHAALQMIKQGRGGRIIGASSVAGKQGWKLLSGYSTTKFAVRGLTQSAALELMEYNITVNAYAPGGVETDMLSSIREAVAKRAPETQKGLNESGASSREIAKTSSTDDIAGLVSYLVSPQAQMITGQSVSINGGRYFD